MRTRRKRSTRRTMRMWIRRKGGRKRRSRKRKMRKMRMRTRRKKRGVFIIIIRPESPKEFRLWPKQSDNPLEHQHPKNMSFPVLKYAP